MTCVLTGNSIFLFYLEYLINELKNLCFCFFYPWKFFRILANSGYLQYKRIRKNQKEFSRIEKESNKFLKMYRIIVSTIFKNFENVYEKQAQGLFISPRVCENIGLQDRGAPLHSLKILFLKPQSIIVGKHLCNDFRPSVKNSTAWKFLDFFETWIHHFAAPDSFPFLIALEC